MPQRFTKHQLFIGRSIWACIVAYLAVSIVDWQVMGRPSAEWTITTFLAIVLGALGFLAANEQVERAIEWMGRTWRAGVAFAIVAMVVLVALLSPYPYFQRTITLGADLPLSGIDKANGEAVKRGIELAIERENSANKDDSNFNYSFKLRSLDDVTDPKGSANAGVGKKNIDKLKGDQRVAGIIGPYNTDVAIKEIPVANAENDRIALISPSTTAECLTGPKDATQTRIQYDCDSGYLNGRDGKGAFFRLAAPSHKMGEVYVGCLSADVLAVAGLCPDMPHKGGQLYKKAVVIDDGSVFSVAFADSIAAYWKAYSKTPLLYGPESSGPSRVEADLREKLAQIQALADKPDLVIFVGSYQNSAVFQDMLDDFSALNDADIAYSTSIMNVAPNEHFLHTSGGDRSYYAVAPLISLKDSSNPNAQKFVSAYREKYKVDPNPYSATGYDAANILIGAIKKAVNEQAVVPNPTLLQHLMGQSSKEAKDFRQAVIEKIRDDTHYESAASATGTYSFARNSNGELRDEKSSAVSVFRWMPSNIGRDTNINGWDFQ